MSAPEVLIAVIILPHVIIWKEHFNAPANLVQLEMDKIVQVRLAIFSLIIYLTNNSKIGNKLVG